MAAKPPSSGKQYGSLESYEAKLRRVAERLGVADVDWNCDRHGCWVTFTYKGQWYRFDHSVENAKAHGHAVRYGSDAFAQVVLALEDLARMVERGIYDLGTWVAGLKFLPAPQQVPSCFAVLGFAQIPSDAESVKERFRQLAKQRHPDAGGDPEEFALLHTAYRDALQQIGEKDTA